MTIRHHDQNVSEKGASAMNTPRQQRIIGNLQQLASRQLAEVLDIVEFLRSRRRVAPPAPDMIDVLGGTYRDRRSSSTAFAQRKQDEIRMEDEKWQRRQ